MVPLEPRPNPLDHAPDMWDPMSLPSESGLCGATREQQFVLVVGISTCVSLSLGQGAQRVGRLGVRLG